MSRRRLRVGAIELAFLDHPGEAAPPVLALHGLASNARWWDLVAARLRPRRRLIAVDLPGHGESGAAAAGYSFEVVAAGLRELLDRLRLERVLVAGHSWGASVALTLAAAEPTRVAGVACIDGGALDLRRVFGGDWSVAEAAMSPPHLEGVDAARLRRLVEDSGLTEGSDLETALAILLANFEAAPAGGLRPRLARTQHLEIARHLYELDSAALLEQVRVPVVFLLAEDGDTVRTAQRRAGAAAALAALAGRGRLRWARGSHDLPVQRPDAVAAALDELAGLATSP